MNLIDLLRKGTPPMPERARRKLAVFCRLAIDLAELSTCRRLQVGCCVVPPDLSEVLAIGYNGPPAGFPNSGCRASGPEDGHGTCGCTHSESNAMVKLRTRATGLVLVVTRSPCEACAGLVVNSGSIAAVAYAEAYRDAAGLQLLERAGIIVACWPEGIGFPCVESPMEAG